MSAQPSFVPPHEGKKSPLGRYWRQILSSIPDAVSVYDEAGNVVYANELASEGLLFSSVQDVLEKNIADITARFTIRNEQGRLMSTEELPTMRAFRDHAQAEATLHCKSIDGEKDFWLAAKAFPIITKHKDFRFVVSTYQEITVYKETEEQLKESNRRMLAILDDLMNLDIDK